MPEKAADRAERLDIVPTRFQDIVTIRSK